jgi:hypothetical protein
MNERPWDILFLPSCVARTLPDTLCWRSPHAKIKQIKVQTRNFPHQLVF